MKRGFTLLEILLVVAIIAILAAIILVAINPSKQLAESRDTQRRSDVNAIMNAFYQYAIKHEGNFPPALDSDASEVEVIGDGNGCGCGSYNGNDCLDVESVLVPEYLAELPMDPKTGTDDNTGYFVNKLSSKRLMVGACEPEEADDIEVTQ